MLSVQKNQLFARSPNMFGTKKVVRQEKPALGKEKFPGQKYELSGTLSYHMNQFF
jgi:hypothetical protein